MKTDDTQVLE